MQLIELAAQYRATGNALRARAATLRLELAAMPRPAVPGASWRRASRVWSRWRARRCARRAISRIIMTAADRAGRRADPVCVPAAGVVYLSA